MNVFNSLGSNYDFKFVVNSLFAGNNNTHATSLKRFLEKKYQGKTVLVYKGREAIQLVLKILNLPRGSAVVINGFTCYAVYQAIVNVGYEVDYLDLDSSNLNFTSERLLKKLKENPQIKVVIIQNTLGYPCKIDEIEKICNQYNTILIEDLAHSVGAIYPNGKKAGTIGDFVVLSFSQDKMIDSVSGGALIIRNNKYQNQSINKLKSLSSKQQLTDKFYPFATFVIRKTYGVGIGKIMHSILKKLNLLSRPVEGDFSHEHQLPNWYCRLALLQFKKLEQDLKHRKKISRIYKDNIDKRLLSAHVVEQIPNSSDLRFPIFVNNRQNLIKFLKKQGIYVSDIWYDAPISPKKYLGQTNYKNQCPKAEIISSKILNLPTHKNVSEEAAKYIAKKINLWLKSH